MGEEFVEPIGERLRFAREQADLTVDDIVFATQIPKSVITALEAAKFSAFSSPLYAKSFLKQYSDYVMVDARPWLDALQPANFVGSEFVNPLWQAPPEPEKIARPAPPVPTGSGFATAALLLVTCGILYGAYRGYQFFDQKFGADFHVGALPTEQPTVATPPPIDRPVMALVKPAAPDHPVARKNAPDTAVTLRADAMAEEAPRARIVR